MNNNDNSSILSDTQKRAVIHGSGPARVIAGPGSGKTTVIINRILYLITHHSILPEHILVITFTKSAAFEMKERFRKCSQNRYDRVTFGTFHAIFLQILKQSFHYQHQDILTYYEKQEILSEILSKLKDQTETNTESDIEMQADEINELLSQISTYHNKAGMPASHNNPPYNTYFKSILNEYEKSKKRLKKIDLDDMILLCFERLKKDEKQLVYWRERFQYILVDEFQDINRMQYRMVELLALPQNNLFVVGDDDQAIYAFRGSDPKILLDFEHNYPGSENIILSDNYRSVSEIVITASNIISENKVRISKKIISKNEHQGRVINFGFKNKEEEIMNIVNLLRRMLQKRSPSEIVILSRTAASFEYLTDQLSIANIPFKLRDKVTDFYSHPIVLVILAYIRFSMTGQRKYFLKIMNKPLRYIKRFGLDEEMIDCTQLLKNTTYSKMVTEHIIKLDYDIKMIREMSPYAAVHYIRKGIGYDAFLHHEEHLNEKNSSGWREILDELQKRAALFQTQCEWIKHIETYQNQLKHNKVNEQRGQYCREQKTREEKDAIMLLTYHGSKGLEWPCVIMPFLNEGNTPHSKAMQQDEIEEERRMFYVAVTRAKTELYLFWSLSNHGNPIYPSRYLNKIIEKKNE